jgi:hypothetical protein
MMNFGKFLLAGVVALGMTACSSDEDATSSKGAATNTFMTVSVTSNALQRTLDNTTTESHTELGTSAESKITSLKIILIDANNKLIKKTNGTDFQMASETATKPFEIATGKYKIYVVANPTAAITAKLNAATTEAQVLDAVMESKFTDYANDNAFVMTSAVNGLGDVDNLPTVEVKAENTIDNPAHATNDIKVDRMAVKIRTHYAAKTDGGELVADAAPVYTTLSDNSAFPVLKNITADGETQTTIAKIQLKGYDIVNKYTKANLYQHWSAANNTFVNQLVAPNYVDGVTASDYEQTKAYYRTLTANAGATTASGFDVIKDLVTEGTSAVGVKTWGTNIYTLESNPKDETDYASDKTKYEDEATGVLFQAQALDANGNGITFYTFNGSYYANLASIQAEYPNVFDPLLTADQLKDATAATKLAAATDATPSDVRAKCDVQVYNNGIMYYSYFIKDHNYFRDAAATMNYYSVMRNSIYDLTVIGLEAIGTDIPFGWQPGDHTPIDKDKTYIQVSLSVNPWVLNTYSFPLK